LRKDTGEEEKRVS